MVVKKVRKCEKQRKEKYVKVKRDTIYSGEKHIACQSPSGRKSLKVSRLEEEKLETHDKAKFRRAV